MRSVAQVVPLEHSSIASRLAWRMLLALLMTLIALLAARPLTARADGIIIPRPPINHPPVPWRNIPLTVKYHHVDVTIDNQVATTHVDQVFVNDADYAVEGTYMFPLPEDAAISSFDMTVDGQKLEGKLLGRDEARAIYEDIVRREKDPALLEYAGRGAFQASIFPIPPHAERRIELTYAQVLSQSNGLVHYRYPLNTEKFSARPLGDVAVTVKVTERAALRAIYSPSHTVQVTRDGADRATVTYAEKNVKPDRDFDLYYSLSQDAIAVNLLTYKAAGEDGFFLLLVTPPVQAATDTQVARDVVLVLDTSGSMEGKKLEQAKSAANYVLDHLGPQDRFNVVSFNTFTKTFADGPQPVARRDAGKSFIAGLSANGSTDINRALLEAFAGADASRPTVVIFLTDGLPTTGEVDPDRIVQNAQHAAAKSVRLFTFGVGYDVDTVLLDQLASTLRGSGAYVKPDQAIDEEVSGFYARISTPVLVDLAASFNGVTVDDMYPYPLPDLFAGTQLVVAGRYRAAGTATLKLSGTVNGGAQSYAYDGLNFVDHGGNDFIPRLWAQRKIGYLLAQIRLNGTSDELVKEVVDLSTRYGIVTPYTSFLVQEPSLALTDAGRQQLSQSLQAAPTMAPAGAPSSGYGGGAAPAAPAAPALAPSDRSGAAAVQRSDAEKALSNATGSGGASADQVRQVGSRAFVLQNGAWVDTSFDQAKMQAEAVAFGSERYFQLLAQYPELAPYLALGDQVTVVLDGRAYSVGASGATAPVAGASATPAAASGEPTTVAADPTPGAAPTATPAQVASANAQATAAATAAAAPAAKPGAATVPSVCSGAGALVVFALLARWLGRRTRG